MKRAVSFACLALLVLTNAAHAQQVVPLNQMVETFRDQAAGWQAALTGTAMRTFGVLAIIELAWACTRMALRPNDLSAWIETLVNEIMFIGLFFWLLSTPQIGTWIINSFRQAAQTAGGVATMHPGDILTIGINLAGEILNQISFWTAKSSLVLVFSGIIIVGCFAYIVAAMVIALVESWMLVGSSTIWLAFGASRWTKDIAIGVLRHFFGLGTRLFVLQLIAATAYKLGTTWVGQIGNMDNQAIMLILSCSLILLAIAWELPKSFERMVNGTSTTHGGSLFAAGAAGIGLAAGAGMVAGRVAVAAAGAGAMAGQAAGLASEQLSASGSPPSGMRYAAAMVGGTARNMASAMTTDLGRRLSGAQSSAGTPTWRGAADLANRRRLLSEDQGRPPPPPPPNSISGNP